VFFFSYFFFQAEDGIRDRDVTGVQTCALPISIAVTQIYFEDTFVFKTLEEAIKAYAELEIEKELITGWFYEEDDFIREVNLYESQEDASKVLIYWLNKP